MMDLEKDYYSTGEQLLNIFREEITIILNTNSNVLFALW